MLDDLTPRSRLIRIVMYTVLAISFALVAVPRAAAAVVRGRVSRVVNGQTVPVPGVAVTLYSQQMGRTSPSYTDASGMYYLNNVPPGVYYLEVWVSTQPLVYQIQVNDPLTGIPPVVLP
jgi:hypothetical protein